MQDNVRQDTTVRASCWSLTINNPTEFDDACIREARGLGWTLIGQLEKGEQNGTPHYQIMLKTPQIRFSAVKAVFKRAKILVARSRGALQNYVQKEETRIGELPEGTVDPKLIQTPEAFWKILREYCDNTISDRGWGIGPWDTHRTVSDQLRDLIQESRTPLAFVDEAVRQLILDGYQRIEHWATYQPIRKQIKLYLVELLVRAK